MNNKLALKPVTVVLSGYFLVAAGTVVALGIMSATSSGLASPEAWVHAVIVAALACLLAVRLRAARNGSRRALRVVGIIAGVLLAVNVVEAAIGLFPTWMRIEMIIIALLMAVAIMLVVRALGSVPQHV